MLFYTPAFFAFFALYLFFHVITPLRYRIWVILLGGTIFYAWWNPQLVWLPHLLALIGWSGALAIARQSDPIRRKATFAGFTVLMFFPLVFFKYFDFLYHRTLQPLLGTPDFVLNMPLPLGVSFISFTMMAYMADYYRGRYPLEPRYSIIGSYMVFFPHLIAGPILRPHEIIPQLERPRPFREANFFLALAIFTMGLFKKLFFADQIAAHVQTVYAGAPHLTVWDYLAAIWGFSVQIYSDFSGYTDMAIGLALILGVRLPNNFRRPYGASSIAAFWRRWHITLSHWLRDYIYIPLGGNRGSSWFQARNILITMLIGGLWHGANWTFVLWGGLHGLGLAIQHALERAGFKKLYVKFTGPFARPLAIAITFLIVSWLWVPFRAPDIPTMLRVASGPWTASASGFFAFLQANAYLVFLLISASLLHVVDTHGRLRFACMFLKKRGLKAVGWVLMVLAWFIIISVNTGSSSKFIYFDF